MLEARTLKRIAAMPLPEIVCRSRQEAAKWIERVTSDATFDAQKILAGQNPALANADDVLALVREACSTRFFAGAADPAWVAAQAPLHAREVVASAADASQHRFDLLGYRTLSFGDPIDWHLDPVWARRAPRVHWSLIDPLNPDVVGDSKIVWELNRHQWIVQLAQAYAFTSDERYAGRCVRAVEGWLLANPPRVGVNWSSSLEVAYRLMSWCWVLALLRGSAEMTGSRATAMLAGIVLHANHVARYLSYYFSPNTHLTGEAIGLFYAGILFPEMKDAARWKELGARVLIEQSAAQICPDGVHFERSTCYHRYTAETYLQFVVLAARNGISLPPALLDRVRGLLEFLAVVRQPDGSLPLVGDSDGGQLLPLVERAQQDSRGVLATGAALFGRADFASDIEHLAPEVAWLMGADGVARWTALHRPASSVQRLSSRPLSTVFPSGGYVVMRTAWTRDAHQMIVDVGPLGCSFSAGHGHADLLSVQCSIFGEACLVDPGTYCYTPETEWRNFFRGTSAHSTVMIDGLPQAEAAGPFSWRAKPEAKLREWRSSADVDFLDADHDAYERLPEPVTHRRRVIFVKPHYWVVIDDVTAGRSTAGRSTVGRDFSRASGAIHQIDVQFQFAPMHVSLLPGDWARAETPGGRALWLASFTSTPADTVLDIKRGELSPIRGWVSQNYGHRQPAPMVVVSAFSALPWRSITVLVPRPDQDSTSPTVLPLRDDAGMPIGLVFEDRRESLLIDDRDFLITSL